MRSAVSVPSNIAEGAERNGKNEFIQFLVIAKGSLGELRTQIMIGLELEYFESEQAKLWISETREISRISSKLSSNRITRLSASITS